MGKQTFAAIVLSAGKGTRMNSAVPKQYLALDGKPALYYSLLAFQRSMVGRVVLVAGQEDVGYCKQEIVEKYGLDKVEAVVAGGKERYHSVFCGLSYLAGKDPAPDYVMIHDGARPLLDDGMIVRCAEAVREFQACAAGMPVKDTVKIADRESFAVETPDRSRVWQIQTPQAFAFPLIYQAYQKLLEQEAGGKKLRVTDDAMVLEAMGQGKVKLVEGSYENIKITTPEDLEVAQMFLERRK